MATRGDRFWDVICLFGPFAYVLFALSTGLLFLTIFGWINGPSAPSSRHLTRLNFVVLSINVVVLFFIIRRCRSREL